MKNFGLKFVLSILIFWALSHSGCVAIVYPFMMLTEKPLILKGTVIDQDEKPVPHARLDFEEWERIFYLPSFFTNIRPTLSRSVTTDESGNFQVPFRLEWLDLKSGSKRGYLWDQDMGEKSWSDHDRKLKNTQILLYDFTDTNSTQVKIGLTPWIPIKTNGIDCFVDLSQGLISNSSTDDSNLVFATKDIGDGQFLLTVRGINGGIVGSANDLPFAPLKGYIPGFSVFYTHRNGMGNGGIWGFFAKSHGGSRHARVIMEISADLPQKIRLHSILNVTGNRFLFDPNKNAPHKQKDMFGWHGPIAIHSTKLDNIGVYRTLIPIPWWRQNENGMYPLMAESDFISLLPPYDEKNWPDQLIRMYFANQIHAPISVFEELTKPGLKTGSIVAANPAVPKVLLLRLVQDPNKLTSENAIKTITKANKSGIFISDYLKSRQNFQNECK